jgi:hypothetical protein
MNALAGKEKTMPLTQKMLPRSAARLAVVATVAMAGLALATDPASAAGGVTVGSDMPLAGGAVTISGTATCGLPSGTATIQVTVSEIVWRPTSNPSFSLAQGPGTAVIACSGGVVGWSIQVRPTTSQFFAPGFLTTVRGSMSQAGAADVAVNGSGSPHF